jgi:hypothetical protein
MTLLRSGTMQGCPQYLRQEPSLKDPHE